MLITFTLAFLLVCGFAVWRWSLWLRGHSKLAHLPTYPQLPLIGSMHYFRGGSRQIFLRFMEILKITEKTQLPFVWWIGPFPCLILSDLEDIRSVTNEFIEKPYYFKFCKPLVGDGLFSAEAALWKRNIKKLAGTFSGNVADGFQDVFNSQAQKLATNLKMEVGRAPFDVLEKYLAVTTLEAICRNVIILHLACDITSFFLIQSREEFMTVEIALGVPKISDRIVTKEHYEALMRTLEILQIRAFNILLHWDFLFGLTSYKKEMIKAIGKFRHVSDTVMKIRQHHANTKGNNDFRNDNSDTIKGSFKSYLDILLELNKKDPTFTIEQVRNEIDTIIVAGQETIATGLFYTMLMIGCHPRVQDKLHNEIKSIFGDSKRDITKEDLARMTYCEAIIYETLRLYPPAPLVMRVADHDLQLKSCTVPKGASCAINIHGVGHSKKYWGDDVQEFKPERFENGSVPAALLAFSTGRRACIGKKYAIPMMKTVIAFCVRELVFISEADKIELKFDIMLRTVRSDLLQVSLRQN